MSVFDEYARPEDAGVSSEGLRRFLEKARQQRDTVQYHGLILLRYGKVVTRMSWAPYDTLTPHTLYSLSKSFCSAAAGFAVSEGLIDWETPITQVLPEEIPEGREEELKQITLKSLLCMGSGLDPESDSHPDNDEVTLARYVLSHRLLYKPMTHFHYNTMGTYLVSCMVQKVTGQTVRDYLVPRLFEKLGIDRPQWDTSPQGVSLGGYGLHLSTESIARFGQCLLERGLWRGQRVLPEGWVELATSEHIANYPGTRQDGNEWGQGYGFQFWRCMDGRYRGDGMYGQLCMVDEKLDAVLAVTCATNDMGLEMRLIRENIFAAFDKTPSAPEQTALLKREIAGLCYTAAPDDGSELNDALLGRTFYAQNGNLGIRFEKGEGAALDLHISRAGEQCALSLKRGAPSVVDIPWRPSKRFTGFWTAQNGMPALSLRSSADPDTLEGVFRLAGKELRFDGFCTGFPFGNKVLCEE